MLLWLVHMCVPTTPLYWSSAECAEISNQENRNDVPEEFKRNPAESQAGRPKPGRPAYVFHQNRQNNSPGTDYIEPAHLQKGHGDWPQVQAGRPHLSAFPRGSSRGAGSTPKIPVPSCSRSNSSCLNSNKIVNELHRKSEIISWKRCCAKFYFIYKYHSTLERNFRIARRLAYWSLWYDDMRLCKFLIQSLGRLYFENTK